MKRYRLTQKRKNTLKTLFHAALGLFIVFLMSAADSIVNLLFSLF